MALVISTATTLQFDGTYFHAGGNQFSAPITIQNSSSGTVVVTLDFGSNVLASASDYIIVAGTSNLTFNGNGSTILVSANNYPGLFSNTTSAINTLVENLSVNAISSGTLANSGGWVFQSNFVGGTANNCSSNGAISSDGGGIFGQYSVGLGNASNGANFCSSSGNIGTSSGGIFGSDCNNMSANFCYSTGNIGSNGGGICGLDFAQGSVNYCYSQGTIGSDGGGIIGAGGGITVAINNCYSSGSQGNSTAGGIMGYPPLQVSVSNCYVLSGSYVSGGDQYDSQINVSVNNSIAQNGPWNLAHAVSTLEAGSGSATKWVSVNPITPFLLYSQIISPSPTPSPSPTFSPYPAPLPFLSYVSRIRGRFPQQNNSWAVVMGCVAAILIVFLFFVLF